MKCSLQKTIRITWNALRAALGTLLGIIMGTALIAYCSRHFTGEMNPSWWGFAISCTLACLYWCERAHPNPTWRKLLFDLYIDSRCGIPPRVERLPDGAIVHVYVDGTRITWKDGQLMDFDYGACSTSR